MSVSGSSVGELSYGVFYLPAVTFGYLGTQTDNPVVASFSQVSILGHSFGLSLLFLIFSVFAVIGAIELHGTTRAIYGPEGPSSRPKHETVQVQHTLAIVLNKAPEEIPLVPCRVVQNGFLKEVVDYFDHIGRKAVFDQGRHTELEETLGKELTPPPRQHRLEICFEQLRKMMESVELEHLFRILYFLPMMFQKYMAKMTFILLLGFVLLGPLNHILLLLLLAHFVLLFQSKIWRPIPNASDVNALEDRFSPEYKIYGEEQTNHIAIQERSPRLRTRKNEGE
ncbi:hypothetical protein [Halomicrococcus sp. SG-WS-1]|uniref:hypothetical protein n=1 Tax=Halomicrococcus sp. SG-WS-1 TaxID=3439057 RepID=UPI003F7A14D9